jgi:hypothetical protein
VSSLTPQAQRILMWRTGHGPGRGESAAQVAHRLGISLRRERRQESAAARAIRLAAATGGCSQSPVSASSAAPSTSLPGFAGGAGPTPGQTTGPALVAGKQPNSTGAGSTRSRPGSRPTITIQKSSLPSLPNSRSGFPWLFLLLAALAVGGLALLASRRSLVLSYVETGRRQRGRGEHQDSFTHGAAGAGAALSDEADDAAAAGAGAAGPLAAGPLAAGPLEALSSWVEARQPAPPTSSVDRGRSLEAQGDLSGAMAAYRRVDADGDAEAARRVGHLLERQGDVEGAIAAYARADERGDPKGSVRLGRLLALRGSLDEALDAFARADRRGDAAGAFNHAVVLKKQGDLRGATAALHRACQRGDSVVAQRARDELARLGVQPE